LEKKHNVSDAEIISLTEEKLRLQAQVIDLERDVEDLSRSRDECRQSAVQEGAQYVEIVRQASQLEERTAEERKSWGILKAEMEKKIEALNRSGQTAETGPSNEAQNLPITDGTETPASPPEPPPILKIEPMSEPSNSAEIHSANDIPAPEMAAPPPPPESNQDSAEALHEEIRRLQRRCMEMEDTLRKVREESRSMEGIVEALGLAGKKITDKANSALEVESSD
jgi:predicted RNase H-like nuclease (RuvC/YqgF family)